MTVRGKMGELYEHHSHTWEGESDLYWLAGLMEEVGELAESLIENDYDNASHELAQIGAIAMNWADRWDKDAR